MKTSQFKMINKNKKAAMEMSVGTIVTVVLLMTVLVMGLVLVRSIFTSSTDAIDGIDAAIDKEIGDLFGEDKKVVVRPKTNLVKIKQEKVEGFGIGIKNLERGSQSDSSTFSYEVVVSSPDKVQEKCGVGGDQVLSWIQTGEAESNIPIATGEYIAQAVLFDIPKGSPLCTFRLRVNVQKDGTVYGSAFMDISIK